ncbi:MAG: hypothetical protein PVH92_07650 [Anaerolineales bacterium]
MVLTSFEASMLMNAAQTAMSLIYDDIYSSGARIVEDQEFERGSTKHA